METDVGTKAGGARVGQGRGQGQGQGLRAACTLLSLDAEQWR